MSLGDRIQVSEQNTHEPFPVADYQNGLFLPKEPWLSPRNAFRRSNNFRVFRGQLIKRGGFTRFAEVTDQTSDQTTAGIQLLFDPECYVYPATPSTERAVPETVSFNWDNNGATTIFADIDIASERWYGNGDIPPLSGRTWVWYWDVVERGTTTVIGYVLFSPAIAGLANAWYSGITWELHSGYTDVDSGGGNLLYRRNPGEDIMGLVKYDGPDGVSALAMDTNNVYFYDSVNSYYLPQGKASAYNYFTGGSEDYFWTWPLETYIVMTNNVDPVHRWDPNLATNVSVVEMPTNWTGGANQLLRCQLVLRFRGRLLYINTTEIGNARFPTRCRFTQAGSNTAWNSSLDYVDGPIELGQAITAQFIGERLFVGFENGWMELAATGDDIQPLEWLPAISRFGAVSKLSTIQDNERLLSRSKSTMQEINPNGQQYIDRAIPDLMQDFNADKTSLCVGVRNETDREFWWTYADGADSRPNNILAATYDEENQLSWSQYDLAFNVFSDFENDQAPTWNALAPQSWNSLSSSSFNSARSGAVGFTQTIGGSIDGMVYRFDGNATDNYLSGQKNIKIDMMSQEWAPYPGQRAHWGWLDIYATSISDASISLFFYEDGMAASYLTRVVALTASGTGSKVYRRVPIGKTAAFHSMRLLSNDDSPFAIDAFVLWMRPAGRLLEFN